jgi:hypothetical protein
VRALDSEQGQQPRAMGSVTGDPEWLERCVAACEAGPVVAQQREPVAERRLGQQRLRPGGAEAPVDQDDGVAGAGELDLELQPDVIALAIAGDEEGTAVHEDALSTEIERLRDPADRLARMVDHSCAILGRTRPIHTVIRGAADKEPFAAELGRRLLHERLALQTERIRRHLGGDLRPGLSVAEAGERYCALASPDLYVTLTAELGWTPEQHRRWLGELLARDLLG